MKVNYKSEVAGLGGITAKCVAKSVSKETGVEITTLELTYPRMVHSEILTHRMFSRNAASSRAIPISKTIEQVLENPAMPVHWGKNQPGMQAKEEIANPGHGENLWKYSAYVAAQNAKALDSAGLHKQVVNRILEPYVFMKTVVTATEWNNWDFLRFHGDADPTICELAHVAKLARDVEAEALESGEWHVPYFNSGWWKPCELEICYYENLSQALAISSSCCAQVSFRSLDPSLEKAERIFDRLVNSKPVHASPFEHQATPINTYVGRCGAWENAGSDIETWADGVTHMDRDGNLWSGNFKSWLQHRQIIADNVVKG